VRRHRQTLAAASLVVAAIAFAGLWYRARQLNQEGKAAGFVQEARMLSYRYPDLAADRLQSARNLAPRLPDLGVDQAYIEIRRHRIAEAKSDVQGVLDRDPNDGPALAIQAGLLRGEKKTAEADALETKARAKLNPNQLHYLALGLEDDVRAIELLSKAIEVAPGNTQALWQRGERYLDLKTHDADRGCEGGGSLDERPRARSGTCSVPARSRRPPLRRDPDLIRASLPISSGAGPRSRLDRTLSSCT
jgi:hypothetical protein